MAATSSCSHGPLGNIEVQASSHATIAGFVPKSEAQRAAAATAHGKVSKVVADGLKAVNPHTFPGPLILPDDDLALDPKYPPQTLRQWANLERQHDHDPNRNTIYFAAAPGTASHARFIQSWTKIQADIGKPILKSAPPSMFDNVLEYLQAFYHGMTVKKFDQHLRFISLESAPKKAASSKSKSSGKRAKSAPADPSAVGLEFDAGGERYVMDIRARTSPHEDLPTYPKQLNLNDLLDAAIGMLPEDAYALLLLVDHDIYEDDEDDFVCGRAYGGSRVAVVSASRYNPALDELVPGLDPEHAWPASHCREYTQSVCGRSSKKPKLKKKASSSTDSALLIPANAAMTRAISAFKEKFDQFSNAPSHASQTSLWLSRVCKTASHELGHCAGMDHCVYYACIMQGTAGLAEDARQPPYLCPVDLAKLLRATGGDEQQRYWKLFQLCSKDGFKEEGMFHALGQWLLSGVLDIPDYAAEMETSVGCPLIEDDPDL